MQQVPNAIPKVIRRTGGANSLELEKENFERGQVGSRGLGGGGHIQGITLFYWKRGIGGPGSDYTLELWLSC